MSNVSIDTLNLDVVAIVGPTGVGKTELAEELAVSFQGEIISADAMQVYRGMDIGTAKPPQTTRRVPYHCIDVVEPGEPYSAALFQRDSRAAIDSCRRRGVLPIVCGGTGLYVRAALDDFEFPEGEQVSNPVRSHYEAIARRDGPAALHALLANRDPKSAGLIHPNNVRRVVRALEMLEQGVTYADQAKGFSRRQSIYRARFLGLTMAREVLYDAIGKRVDAMLAAGLLDEVEHLLKAGFRSALTAAQAIGYKELVPVLENDSPLDEAVEAIKAATRRYAKRQLTWFRADPRITWLDVTDLSLSQRLRAAIEALR